MFMIDNKYLYCRYILIKYMKNNVTCLTGEKSVKIYYCNSSNVSLS